MQRLAGQTRGILNALAEAGVTVLERFVAEVRSRMELHLWRLLGRDVTQTQRHRLDELLKPAEGSRQS